MPEMPQKVIVCQPAGVEDVTVCKGAQYSVSGDKTLSMDIYYPPNSTRTERLPVVVFVFGYPDALGYKLKETGQYVSWARATAASGLSAVTYEVDEPVTDIGKLLTYLRQNASSLGIDESRIGIWSCSGNVPVALWALMQDNNHDLKCAVLYYGYLLDRTGSTTVADVAKKVGFVNPCAGRTIADLPRDIPLLMVRAGRDSANLNDTLDRFLVEALARNLPVTFINYPDGVHAFDILDNTEMSGEIIRQTLDFMRFHLLK